MNFSYRCLTYFTDSKDRIDVYNTFYGKETVYYNGNLVSDKLSILGAKHRFIIEDASRRNIFEVHIAIKWPLRVGFDIFVNGQAVLLS
jgi:hypothetical protein